MGNVSANCLLNKYMLPDDFVDLGDHQNLVCCLSGSKP